LGSLGLGQKNVLEKKKDKTLNAAEIDKFYKRQKIGEATRGVLLQKKKTMVKIKTKQLLKTNGWRSKRAR